VHEVGGQRRDAAILERRVHVVVAEVDRVHEVLEPEGVRLAPDHLLFADAQLGVAHLRLEVGLTRPAPGVRAVEAVGLDLAVGEVLAEGRLLLDRVAVTEDHVGAVRVDRREVLRSERQ
jgi:hypothetical protein